MSFTARDTSRTLIYLKQLIKKTPLEKHWVLENRKLKSIEDWSFWNSFEAIYADLKLEYYNNFNEEYSQDIVRLFSKDQFVREEDELVGLIAKVDSSNYHYLVELYNKYGFPRIEIVGNSAFQMNYIMLMHHTMLGEDIFIAIQSILQEQMDLNVIEPWRYANIMDRYSFIKKQSQKYGTYTGFVSPGKSKCEKIENV